MIRVDPVVDRLSSLRRVGWYGAAGVSFDPDSAGTCPVCEAEDAMSKKTAPETVEVPVEKAAAAPVIVDAQAAANADATAAAIAERKAREAG